MGEKEIVEGVYMKEKLFEFQQLVKEAELAFKKENVHVISTAGYDLTTNPKGRNSKHDRRDWADKTCEDLYHIERSKIVKGSRKHSSGEYSFAYVKFAEDAKGNVYGIVSGKSSFHAMYPGDVWFYDLIDNKKKDAACFMRENNMKWHADKILIVLNDDPQNHIEAYKNEKKLKELNKDCDLYD